MMSSGMFIAPPIVFAAPSAELNVPLVGKVPLSIIWQTYAVSFAFAGLAANSVYLSRAGALRPITLAWTLPGALVFGYLVTRVLGRAVGRMVADPKQEATTRRQLASVHFLTFHARYGPSAGGEANRQ